MPHYLDDSSIGNNEDLWRRVPPWHIIYDENLGRLRPSKAAFEDHPSGSPMSILFATLVLESNRTGEQVLADHSGFALAAISAGLGRSKQQAIARDPLPEEPAHGVVAGRKTDSVKRFFAKAALWVVAPTGTT